MSIFDTSTSIEESPEIGQEEAMPEEQQNLEGADNQSEADPEAGQEAETDSSPEPGQEEQPEEEMVSASTHKELRAAFTRKAQEAAELRRQLEARGNQAQPPVPGQGQTREPQTMAEFQQQEGIKIAQMREEGYHEAIIDLMVKADTAEFKINMMERGLAYKEEREENNRINSGIDALIPRYPEIATEEGFALFSDKIRELQNDMGTRKLSDRILKMAAAEVWPESKTQLYQTAKAKGKQEALDNIRAKQGVTTTTTKKPNEQPKSLEDQIADNIMNAGRSGGIFG